MSDNPSGRKPIWLILLIAVGILSIHAFGGELVTHNLLIPIVVIIMILAFGALLWKSLKEWKKSDEEIVSNYRPLADFFRGTDARTPQQKATHFLGAAAVAALFLYNSREYPGAASRYIICGISLLLFGIPLLLPWLAKVWGIEEPERPRLRPEIIAAIIVGLLPTGFMCFFCGIGIYHGVWWFILPPGLVFLSFFSRPLVAGIRVLLSERKDTGKDHSRNGPDEDPWDRPDIER